MENFINNITATLGEYVPTAIGALIIFLIGFLIAKAISAGVIRLLHAMGVDERLNAKSDKDLKIENLVGSIAFYLILLYVILISLGVLGVSGVLDPAMEMMSRMLSMLPNIIAAGLIGVAGYIVARVVSEAVRVLSSSIDGFGSKIGLGDSFKISRIVGTVVFISIFVPLLISALDALQIKAISEPATELLNSLLAVVPQLLGAALIMIVALIGGRFIRDIIGSLLRDLGADQLAEKAGAGGLFKSSGFSSVMSNLAFFFIMLAATLSAVEMVALDYLADSLQGLLTFASQIVIGLAIILVGNFLANLAYRQLQQDEKPTTSARIAKFAILGLVLAMGLSAMGVADNIVELAFALILGAIAIAVALAFGLGGREAAGKHMEHILSRWRDNG